MFILKARGLNILLCLTAMFPGRGSYGSDFPLRKRKYVREEVLRFTKRYNSLKAILRRIEKQNYEKGTIVFVPNWYVGYADITVIV